MAFVTATTGIDNFTGAGGPGNTTNVADEILFTNQDQLQAGDTLNGGAGTDTLRLGTSIDFSIAGTSGVNTGLRNLEIIRFNGAFTATFRSDQFGAGLLVDNLTLRGLTTSTQIITINMVPAATTLNMFSWQFSNWSGGTDIIRVNGSSGNDRIIVSSQHTEFDGGAGSDTLDYSGWGGGFTLTLNGATWANATWTSGLFDTIRNVENVLGSADADTIIGDGFDNFLAGNGGNDTLSGGLGNDTLDGGTGADTMTGGVGDDTFVVDNAGDVVIERATDAGVDLVLSSVTFDASGTDQDGIENVILTGTGAINATGNALNNILVGNSASNVLIGNAGDDTLDGGAGADTMNGGVGSDTYYVDNLSDVVIDRATDTGTDLVFSSVSFDGTGTDQEGIENITLIGTANTNATGNALNNVLVGNSGNNVLDGLTGADTMEGGAGDDTYYVDNLGDTVIDRASNLGVDLVFSSVTFDASGTNQDGIENVTLTGTAAINATGNALNNVLTGNGANNLLNGGDGNDTLIGGLGNDTLTGGAGADIFAYAPYDLTVAQYDVITDFSIAQGDRIAFGANGPASFEAASLWLIRQDQFGNTVLNGNYNGGVQRLIITGVSASSLTESDFIFDTSADPRVLVGSEGYDVLFGGLGNDTLIGGNGRNFLIGDAGSDNITGGNDVDVMDGGSGADTMTGGLGNDTYYVDNVGDIVNESAADPGIDRICSWVDYAMTGTAAGVELGFLMGTNNINLLGNALDNRLTGNSGSNVLNGGDGNDTLIGNAGNDTLIGGAGNDLLQGGTGADVFEFASGSGADTIADFNGSEDRIDVRAYGVDSAADAAAFASNVGSSLLINFGGGNQITINNMQVAQIHDGMFVV
jgi:Ca2+-binding RTX toxin-like protein